MCNQCFYSLHLSILYISCINCRRQTPVQSSLISSGFTCESTDVLQDIQGWCPGAGGALQRPAEWCTELPLFLSDLSSSPIPQARVAAPFFLKPINKAAASGLSTGTFIAHYSNSLSFASFRPWLKSHLPTSLSKITQTPTLSPHCPDSLFSLTRITFQPLCVLLILLIPVCNSTLSSMRGRILSDFFCCVSSVHLGIEKK